VSVSPTILNGIEREVDDFQPRKRIKQLFQSEGEAAFKGEKLQEFCNKYIIDMNIVKRYVEHLQTLELNKDKRKTKRNENTCAEIMKNYKDLNWISHYENNSLAELKVKTLDKYLEENDMIAYLSLKKKDKVVAVSHHIAFGQLKRSLAVSSSDTMVISDGESESEADEEDVIINIAGIDDSSSASSEGEDG